MGDASTIVSASVVSSAPDRDHSSSDESEIEVISPAQNTTQRRKLQKENFEALLAERAVTCDAKAEPVEDVPISTARLFTSKNLEQGTLDPREYQIELFERAKVENTIAVLATGAGKTLIAVLLLKYTIEKELNSRADGEPHRISFFLVDSVALSYQQAGFLQNNLDTSVGHIFGALGTDFWSRATWQDSFKKYMVIVCTAEILHLCLLHAHIGIKQINLLIFDEAHHTKKDHVYARIIRDSYLRIQPSKRPRILGMTASPVDTKDDPVEGAMKLEALLDSKIATASELSQINRFVQRPTEEAWTYDKLEAPFQTELHRLLDSRFGDIEDLKSAFRFSRLASSDLGRWCSDGVWKHVFSDRVLPKLEGKSRQEFSRLQEASEIARSLALASPGDPGQISQKAEVLRKKLSYHYQMNPDTKCIVFTEMRLTALMLMELFNALEISNLRPGMLIGARSDDLTAANISFRQQFLALVNFRSGKINCLFATTVAEEGLDIADCNLVVRFDLFKTMIQYVQSRGRARQAYSTYASIIQKDNIEHQDRLLSVQNSERIMQMFCESLPEDRILKGNDWGLDSYPEEAERAYTIKSSGARLTYHSALSVLARYSSSLQYEGDATGQVTYVVLPVSGAFVCEVILPERSPIRGLTGAPAMNKSTAKRSAAFDTCVMLRKNKLLDDHFNSVYHRRLPAMRNAKLAITCKKTNQYDMLVKPSLWGKGRGTLPDTLYATFISFKPTRPLSRRLTSIILLTRERLPALPEFPIFLEDNDVETVVHTESVGKACTFSPEQISAITVFTLRIFEDVFQKVYSPQPENMPYWLVPAIAPEVSGVDIDLKAYVDWDTINLDSDSGESLLTEGTSPETLCDRFIFDPWDGRCRFFTLSVDESLRPSDPPPADVPHRPHMDSIMNYCISLSKNSRARFLSRCNWDQPVFRAELVRLRRNLLDKMSDKERETKTRCFVCLEPLRISALPASVAASCLTFPAVSTRLDAYLVTLEACDYLDLVIRPELALEAFTKDSDSTEEHRIQQIHLQRGMGKNYERLEFLGDCFLKMATSISLFAQNPNDDEFDYHVRRMCLICNKNLYNTAIKKEIYRFIRSQGFSRRTWYPEGLSLLKGKDHSKKLLSSPKHALAEKTIADVCEALIGASLLSGGTNNRFDTAVKAVTLLVDHNDHKAASWKDYIAVYSLPGYQTESATGFERELVRIVEEKVGYHFQYPKLLHSAITHPSYPSAWATVPCYQRLEFLGDSLLDMACVEDLFARYPDRDPQWLTEHKMAMVSNKFLGALAVKLGLHSHIKLFSAPLISRISRYADEIKATELENDAAVDFWTGTTDPPKCLPDMVEAYIGAIFIDANFDFHVVEEFYQRHIKPFFYDMAIYDTFANKHPTTFLHNRLTNEYGCTDYCVKSGEIPAVDGEPPRVLAAVMIHDTVIAEGFASSGRYAKVKASEKALEALEKIGKVEFCERFKCNCSDEENPPEADLGTAI
ncbi:hypothetical protein BJY04DRAFT_212522 [Aspergillus karnatakaensis]|uniref:putative RNA helicase/RNAse III n=1 Tax=Aspergillus karnatakaensis TaxID=1810916 RepID=UPI003CCDD108